MALTPQEIEQYRTKYKIAPTLSTQQTTPNEQGGGIMQKAQDFSTGFTKGLISEGVNTARMFQGLGQRTLAAIDPTKTLEDIRATTGFSSLQGEQAKQIDELLKAENTSEKAGKLTEFVASLLVPTGSRQAVSTVATKGADVLTDVAKPVISKTGTILKGAGEQAYGLTVTPSEKTAGALLKYDAKQPSLIGRVKNFIAGIEPVGTKPITEAETAARKGLVGTEYQLGVQSQRVADDLWKGTISPKLKAVKGQINFQDFLKNLETKINKTPELGRRADLKEALNAFKNDFSKVSKISAEKLQQYKEGWAKFIPEKTYKGKPIGSAFKDIQNMAAEEARRIIYKNIGEEGKQAYLDYGNLQSIIEAGKKSITGDAAKRSLGRNVWEFVMDKAVTPVATVSGKILYRTGEGLEFIGKEGAKKVKDLVN